MHLRLSSIDIFDMHSRDQHQASREAKKYLLSIERNDWEWPPPAYPSASASGTAGPATSSPANLAPSIRAHALVEGEPVDWRERYYGTSDDEDENNNSKGAREDGGRRSTSVAADRSQERGSKVESPDGVGGCTPQQRSARRKRRRKAKLEEELCWNEGLRCFVERRNAWTSARLGDDHSQSALVLQESEGVAATTTTTTTTTEEAPAGESGGPGGVENGDAATPPVVVTCPSDAVCTMPEQREGEQSDTETPISRERSDRSVLKPPAMPPSRPSSRGRGGKRVATPAALPGPIPNPDPVIPIPPPLFDPANPLRAAIRPKAYPNIYTQIVQSTRTPTVPIPLADMTRVLVTGWKDAGEWPPKSAPQEILTSTRRRTINGREETIGQILKDEQHPLAANNSGRRKSDYTGDDGIGGHGISVSSGLSIGEGLLSNHHHLRRGVEGVKRVLRLSGSHDKGSSHGSEHGDEPHGTAAVL